MKNQEVNLKTFLARTSPKQMIRLSLLNVPGLFLGTIEEFRNSDDYPGLNQVAIRKYTTIDETIGLVLNIQLNLKVLFPTKKPIFYCLPDNLEEKIVFVTEMDKVLAEGETK